MNKIFYIIWLLVALAGCSKKDLLDASFPSDSGYASTLPDGHSPNIEFTCIVTVKKSATDTLYFQQNKTLRLFPVNFQQATGLSKRLLCKVRTLGTLQKGYGQRVEVLWHEPIDEGTVRNTNNPSSGINGGGDGLNILFDEMTSFIDGCLTLHYVAWWGKNPVHHDFTLAYSPDDPTKIYILHHANGDQKEVREEGLVYFDLSSLPFRETDKYFALYWTSIEGKTQQRQILIR